MVRNFQDLATTPERTILLNLIDTGFAALQPEAVLKKSISLEGETLIVQDKQYNLADYQRIFLIGFGKGAAKNAYLLEQLLMERLTDGYVIDVIEQQFAKLNFTKGTHPLPSAENVEFTKQVVEKMESYQLTQKDLVLVVICGGGSAMFELPKGITFEQKIAVDKTLLHCGANIKEMNVIRKHLSAVKGGGLAKILYPAEIVTLVYSDVPGNDLSTIASGPTVKDASTLADVRMLLEKYPQLTELSLNECFMETPKEDQYFEHVSPVVMLSNITALNAMKDKATELGYEAVIYSDQYQADANEAGKFLIEQVKPGQILLAGGETTVKVTGNGEGGRNQQLVLAALPYVGDAVTIASVGTDGWDNSHNAGGIVDNTTVEKAEKAQLNPEEYIKNNDSLKFLEKTNDALVTGKLPSNVADIILVLRKKDASLTIEKPQGKTTSQVTEIKTGEISVKTTSNFVIPELHDDKVAELEDKATQIRQLIIETLLEAGSGHSAGPLGMADIFACMYFHILNIDPKNPTDPDRDRLVLSNGHICPVQYVTMALAGFFPVEELKTLRKINSRLQGHPHRGALPGVENTSGPLGEGLSQAIGMALAAKLDKKRYQVYCLTSDGEHQEGNTWEAIMFAGKYKVNNLTVIIDRNNIQIDGVTEQIMPLEPLRAKYEAFNWSVIEIDGHNYRAIVDAVREANSIFEKPTCIIAHTIPGRGVDFMEENYLWHGKPPNPEEAKKALNELRTLQGRIKSEHE